MDHIVPEPLQFVQDAEGGIHFVTGVLPMRTIIDVHSLPVGFGWLRREMHKIIITCDGRTIIYKKVARDIHGYWICEKVSET